MSRWRFVIATAAIAFVLGVASSPVDISSPATDLLPPREDSSTPTTDSSVPIPATDLLPPNFDGLPTLSTDLQPPKVDSESTYDASAKSEDVPTPATELLPPFPSFGLIPPRIPSKETERKGTPATLFLINVFAVKNHTAEDSNEVLHSDVMKEVSEETSEPLAMFLLVVEDDNESSPVSLDEVAKDLEAEGFSVQKIGEKDGETRLIKVDLGSALEKLDNEEESRSNAIERVKRELSSEEEDDDDDKLDDSGRIMTIRRKRHLCLKCKLDELKQKKFGGGYGGGYGGGGCGGGCGGGGGYPPPNYYPPPPPPVYHPPPPPPQRPPPQFCDPCQNGGGGGPPYGGYGNGGGGNSFSQASAQASASASSYGK